MSRKVYIDLSKVRSINANLPNNKTGINSSRSCIRNVRNQLPANVRCRNNIEGQFTSIDNQLKEVENKIGQLYTVVNKCLQIHENTEKRILSKAKIKLVIR